MTYREAHIIEIKEILLRVANGVTPLGKFPGPFLHAGKP